MAAVLTAVKFKLYAIGVAEPIAIYVDTFGTGKISEDDIIKLIRDILICGHTELLKC